MVIGKSYKENSLLIIILYLFLLICFISGIVVVTIFIEKILTKIVLISVISLFIILISYSPYYVYKCKKIPEDIIVYNLIDETIKINGYKKNYTVNVSDIIAITVHNLGTKILFSCLIEEGKLCFYLKDGTKIKTVEIDKVYDVYGKLDEIVFLDKETDSNISDQLIVKLDGWGSKKEYPSIVSVLVALFIPFFGVFFVSNQKEFKQLKYGKTNSLMTMALIISSLWLIAIIVFVCLL